MPISKLLLPERVPVVPFLVERNFPRGHLTLLYSHAGVGKTRLLSYLAVQVTRPRGAFGEYETLHGPVVILDADDPSGVGYAQWVNRFLRGYPDADRTLIDHRAVDGGLTPTDLEALANELRDLRPALIIVDSFAAAFLGVDVLKPDKVHAPLRALVTLAKETGAAVVIADHVGKLAPKQTVADKGAMGTAQKNAAPRAVFALDRLPPSECEGRDVLRLVCTKQSYAPLPAPVGLEVVLEDEVALVKPYKLPGVVSLEDKARATLLDLIISAGSEGIRRTDLLKQAVKAANVGQRTTENALARLEATMGAALEIHTLGERGSPKVYVYVLDAAKQESASGTENVSTHSASREIDPAASDASEPDEREVVEI